MNAFIRLLYALLIALSVVTFVGVAIFSFYQPPKAPAYASYGSFSSQSVIQQQQATYDTANKIYKSKEKTYERNVSIVLLVAAVFSLGIGLGLLARSGVIGEGLSLGGVAISIYAIIAASIADARVWRFLAVTLLLLSVLLLAQRRFMGVDSKRA